MRYTKVVVRNTLLFSVFALTVSSAGALPMRSSVWNALDLYGINTTAQKNYLLYLMQVAGIKDAQAILKTETNDPEIFLENLISFVENTQEYFVMHKGSKERWEVKTKEWMTDTNKQASILQALDGLGVIREKEPSISEPDAVCVLGARKSSMDQRLGYAKQYFNRGTLILLAGERYVTLDKNGFSIDGDTKYLQLVADRIDSDEGIRKSIDQITETDLIKQSFFEAQFSDDVQSVVIDTPRGDLPRPTTETTLNELCSWLECNLDVKRITFVSNQPHVAYQSGVIARVLEQRGINIEFEVVGPEFNVSVNPENAIKQAIGGLGSSIFAATPGVVSKLQMQINNTQLYDRYAELFVSQPLVYKSAQSSLTLKPR